MISIRGLHKTFRVRKTETAALRGVDLEVEEGEFFVLLGPSGSGKSTLLRCLAGLERPEGGEIVAGGKVIFSCARGISLAPEERGLGMVFQSYAIWPHLSVADNVGLVLRHGKGRLAEAEVRERIREALALVQLEGFEERPARLLSGGQQQRVALARALATNPRVLLMDEPLSNLDARLREEVRAKIKELVRRLEITTLYVTHDQVEAMVLADRIAVMAEGAILQVGDPYRLYRFPVDARVAEFFGSINWLAGTRLDERRAGTAIGAFEIEGRLPEAARVMLGIRPEDFRLGRAVGGANEFESAVLSRTFVGDQIFFELEVGGQRLFGKMMADGAELGPKVVVHVPREKIIVFPQTG
jgi:iron(III) transport system ATP-binding protein